MNTEIFLENDSLKLKFKSIGAELKSIYSVHDNVEFLWQGPSELWERGAPVLFPVIASLRNNRYYHNNNCYDMNIHGFALHQQFEVYKKSQDELCFLLRSNDMLKKIYPFDYEIFVTYKLTGNEINIKYEVRNTGSPPMYFSVGGHPTFNCPLFESESFEDYFISFEKAEDLNSIKMEGPYLIHDKKNIKTDNNHLHLHKDLFKENALVFENLASSNLTLNSTKNNWRININYKDFPYIGIFANSHVESDKFVCIEPWFGIPDYIEGDRELSKKPGIVELQSQTEFSCIHSIAFAKHN